MSKEEFKRDAQCRNIGDIKYVTREMPGNVKNRLIQEVMNNHIRLWEGRLMELIQEYGEEKGKLLWNEELKEADKRWKMCQEIEIAPEEVKTLRK